MCFCGFLSFLSVEYILNITQFRIEAMWNHLDVWYCSRFQRHTSTHLRVQIRTWINVTVNCHCSLQLSTVFIIIRMGTNDAPGFFLTFVLFLFWSAGLLKKLDAGKSDLLDIIVLIGRNPILIIIARYLYRSIGRHLYTWNVIKIFKLNIHT